MLPMGPLVLLPPGGSPSEWGPRRQFWLWQIQVRKYKYKCVCMCVCACVHVYVCVCVCVRVCSEQVLAVNIALRHFICTTHAQFFSSPLVAHAVNIVVELLMQSVEVLVRHSVVSMSTRQLSSTTLTNHNCWTILSSVIKKCMPQLFLHFWCTL